MIQLRGYQTTLADQARAALRRVQSVLIQSATGSGKTGLACFIAGESSSRGAPVWFMCHRAELVQQTSLTFDKYGIAHGFIAAGHPVDLSSLVHVCSIDTLKNRLALLTAPRIAIIDEAHHSSAAGWAVVVQWLRANRTKIIGLSATPQRLDGTGLDDSFDEMVLGPSVAWLMEQGFLSPYRIFAPPAPPELRAKGRDDDRGGQARVLNTPKLTGDVVQHWARHAKGLRTIGFACNVSHSLAMVAAFNAAGIPAAHLDGGMGKRERKQVIADFAAGRIQVLWNVALFGEGFDLSAIAQTDVTIDCVILNRKTLSLSLFLQMVGRALRPADGKVAVILDHADNTRTHGFPDDEHIWLLEGRAKGKAANDDGPPPPMTCDGCFMQIRHPVPDCCPYCAKKLRRDPVPVAVAAGDLGEITELEKKARRQDAKAEQAAAKTMDELVSLARGRGYKDPMTWARTIFFSRIRSRQAA